MSLCTEKGVSNTVLAGGRLFYFASVLNTSTCNFNHMLYGVRSRVKQEVTDKNRITVLHEGLVKGKIIVQLQVLKMFLSIF